MATGLKRSKVDIERVLVSPYLRAEQTLDIVGGVHEPAETCRRDAELTPCGDVEW